MKKNSFKGFSFYLLFLALVISSCAKKGNPDKSIDTTNDFVVINNFTLDIFQQVDVISKKYQNGGNNPLNCSAMQVSGSNDSTYPKTVVASFTYNCPGSFDQRKRDGTITVVFNGNPTQQDNVLDIAVENYKIENATINCTASVTMVGINSDSAMIFNYKVSNGTIDYNGSVMSFGNDLFFEFTEGNETQNNYFDDEFLISGTYFGSDGSGKPFSAEISNKLSKSFSCRWVKEGSVDVIPDDLFPRILDYGFGCDAVATAIIGFDQFDVNLP